MGPGTRNERKIVYRTQWRCRPRRSRARRRRGGACFTHGRRARASLTPARRRSEALARKARAARSRAKWRRSQVSPRRPAGARVQEPDGAPLTLADFKGRALVLNLWATWCVPCRAEMPALDQPAGGGGRHGFRGRRGRRRHRAPRARAGVSRRHRRQGAGALRRPQRRPVGKAARRREARSACRPAC